MSKILPKRAVPKKIKISSARKKVRKPGDRSRSSRGQPIDADVEREARLKLFKLTSPSRPYSGQLKNPIVRASKLELVLRGGPEEQERLDREENARIVVEQLGKLLLLLDHFEIPKNSRSRWFRLAFQLARQHVPGMKIIDSPKPRRGPKGKWKARRLDSELIMAVAIVERERGKGPADAIRSLIRRQPNVWGQFKDKEKSLRTRYYEALRLLKPYRRDNLIESLAAWLLPEEPPK